MPYLTNECDAPDLILESLQPEKLILVEGGAGTGKTTLLCALAEKRPNALLAAPTGLAASAISGFTLHSAFRISPECPARFSGNLQEEHARFLASRDLIIIDEISMVRADVLDAADACMKAACKTKSLFGGKPVVLFGDLYQLAPVVRVEERQTFCGMGYNTPWFFGAHCLQNAEIRRLTLTRNWRQSQDAKFAEILNRIRVGSQTDDDLSLINQRVVPVPAAAGVPVLTTNNIKADRINNEELDKVSGEDLANFEAQLSGGLSRDQALKCFTAPLNLRLKKGARYMVLANGVSNQIPYYNGMTGVCSGLFKDETNSIEAVKFLPDGMEDCIFLTRKSWSIKRIEEGRQTEWSLTQFPLKPAYAITIHKSQGMTLNAAVIDFSGGTFASGQAYVALSRVRSLDGLTLKAAVNHFHILADKTPNEFLNKIPLLSNHRIP